MNQDFPVSTDSTTTTTNTTTITTYPGPGPLATLTGTLPPGLLHPSAAATLERKGGGWRRGGRDERKGHLISCSSEEVVM